MVVIGEAVVHVHRHRHQCVYAFRADLVHRNLGVAVRKAEAVGVGQAREVYLQNGREVDDVGPVGRFAQA